MLELLAVLLFFAFLVYLIYGRQKKEVALLKEEINNVSQNIPAIKEEINNVSQRIPTIVENAVLKTFQSSTRVFENLFVSAITRNSDVIKGAFATSLKELGIQEDIGKLREASSDLKAITSDLKTMFQVKHARAKFGEMQLENLLKDIFPANRIMLQKNIGSGIPDACILVEEGKFLCIDSKFPLENFKKYAEAEGEAEKKQHWRNFIEDLKHHVDDIKKKYVGKGNTLDYAFMFVPSDVIFYHIISDAPDLAVEASKAGVILTSPSILPAYLSLISAKIQAQEISKRAEEIQKKLEMMGNHIEALEGNLETLFRHIDNASKKTSDVRKSLGELKSFYASLCRFEEART